MNLVSGKQQLFRMCALQHYYGAYKTLLLEFHDYELSNRGDQIFTLAKYRQSSNKTAILGIYLPLVPRHLASKTIAHRGLAKKKKKIPRVVLLLPLLHTSK